MVLVKDAQEALSQEEPLQYEFCRNGAQPEYSKGIWGFIAKG